MRRLSALLVSLFVFAPPAPAAEKFNIVAVVTDDQARWSVGSYGNKECRTPNMDRLAREGALFTNAFVPTPVCSPSRASYMTGMYGSQLGIVDWIAPKEAMAGVGLSRRVWTWPRVLQQAGYTTGLVGKWHLGMLPQFHPTKHGLNYFIGGLGGGFSPLNPTWEVGGKDTPLKGYSANLTGDEAVKFLEANKGKPFALLVHFREPHLPYTPMPEEDRLYKDLDPTIPKAPGIDVKQVKQWHREYYACIHAVDRNLGRILDALEKLKLNERTIVTFTSDHGYNIGHHGIHAKGNGYWVAGGVRGPTRANMFDTSLRVPLLVRWPGAVKPGTVIDEVVSNIDMFPSVSGMLGVPPPKEAKPLGMDFSPLLRGKKTAWRDALYGTYDLHNSGLAYMRMIRTDKAKLVRHHRCNDLDELYDLAADPGETTNRYGAAKYAKVREELQKRLTAWMQSIDDPLLKTEAMR